MAACTCRFARPPTTAPSTISLLPALAQPLPHHRRRNPTPSAPQSSFFPPSSSPSPAARQFHTTPHPQRKSGEALLREQATLDGTQLEQVPKSRLWRRDYTPEDRDALVAHHARRSRSRLSPASFTTQSAEERYAATPWEARLAQLRASGAAAEDPEVVAEDPSSRADDFTARPWHMHRDNNRRVPGLHPEQREMNKHRPGWVVQKEALARKFPEGWNPLKKLSPDAMEGIRALHRQFPQVYTTSVLANKFEVSPEAIRRILSSKWTPTPDQEARRQERWIKRGESVWERYSALGIKPPRRWRDAAAEGSERETSAEYGFDEEGGRPSWGMEGGREGGRRAEKEAEQLDLGDRIGANLF